MDNNGYYHDHRFVPFSKHGHYPLVNQHIYGKSQFLQMAIFNSYVCLPEGTPVHF